MSGSQAADNRKVLSYHDVLLRVSDVELLTGPYWLNDQVIAFYFEYLLHELYPSMSDSIALVPGSLSFLLLTADPIEARFVFEALQLHSKELVIFAVNDNPDVEVAAGGFHWSCLAYNRAKNRFNHYDSARPHNYTVAKQLASAATPLVRGKESTHQHGDMVHPDFADVKGAPQQQNGFDCGLYVLAVARALCAAHAKTPFLVATLDSPIDNACCELGRISPSTVVQLRSDLLDIINTLAMEA